MNCPMVRLPKLTANQLRPPISYDDNLNSNLNSKVQNCLPLINSIKRSEKSRPFSWNDPIKAYATYKGCLQRNAIHVFLAMRRSGAIPNEHTFPFLFKACASFSGLEEGRQIHGDVIKHGLAANVYVQNTLIHFYGSCKKIFDACKVFDEMCLRTIVSWNSMIGAYVESAWFGDSIECFVTMRRSGFGSDETTMVTLLSACAELGNLSLGKWVHSQVNVKGMVLNVQLGTSLVEMYAKCGALNYASLVFDRMITRNVWTWSAMILGLAQHGFAVEALDIFSKMKTSKIIPNYVTFLGVLCACSHAGLVEEGKRVFYDMEVVHGIKPHLAHYGAMVDILGRAGRLEEAYAYILNMPVEADATIWRTLLSACNIHDVNDYSGVAEKVRRRLFELEPRRSGNFVMLANKYAKVGSWEKAAQLRSSMRHKGLKKMAGESCVELGGSMYIFLSGDDSQVGCGEIFLLLDRLNSHLKMVDRILSVEHMLS